MAIHNYRCKREVAIFAGGCFWGVEDNFLKRYPLAEKKGILETSVGFIGGEENGTTPTLWTIASTGHVEALRIEFDPRVVSYAELVEFFYRTHDPTNVNRQGDDVGPQFRSAIFTHSPDQFEVAKRMTDEVQERHFTPQGRKIVTEIIAVSGPWWRADDKDQQYLSKWPYAYRCKTHQCHQW
ncbi:peptide methionine sulfoxide reductase [Marasmius fiardii PR-910]|nr:peptide methionine sulfoxide reductase [Marasmius fiardii PR-910]